MRKEKKLKAIFVDEDTHTKAKTFASQNKLTIGEYIKELLLVK